MDYQERYNRYRAVAIMWGTILFGLLTLLTLYGVKQKKLAKRYAEYEEKITSSTKNYLEQNNINDLNIKYTLEELKDLNVITIEYDCDGYVKREKETEEIKTYLKCENYETKGYSKFE